MSSRKDTIIRNVNNIAQFMAKQIYFRAMRDAFAMVVPFLVLTGFIILLNNVILDSNGFMGKFLSKETLNTMQIFGTKIMNGTMNILSFLIIIFISYSLSITRKYGNPILVVTIAVSCMIILMPTSVNIIPSNSTESINVSNVIHFSLTNAGGIFVAIFTGILSTELFIKLSSIKRLQIQLNGNVPLAVINTFNSLISVMLTLAIFSLFSFLLVLITGYEFNEIIIKIIQAPLVHLTTSLPGFLVLCMFTNLLFFFGIHAGGIINPILEPPLLVAMQLNTQAFASQIDIPNIIVLPFRDLYGHIGGTGSTIALLIVIFLFSKRSEHKKFANMVIPTSIFNINEPIIFGFPILFNPFMLIPFVFGPLVLFVIAYFATYFRLVSPIVAYVPWYVPPLINGWLASGGDFRNVILQLVLIVVQVIIYIPFLKMYERSLDIIDNSNKNENK